MKTGKITAKLRDAVPVCLMVEGNEVMRYKNIELPDALKEVEIGNDERIIFGHCVCHNYLYRCPYRLSNP